jgi:hypothetical protein
MRTLSADRYVQDRQRHARENVPGCRAAIMECLNTAKNRSRPVTSGWVSDRICATYSAYAVDVALREMHKDGLISRITPHVGGFTFWVFPVVTPTTVLRWS